MNTSRPKRWLPWIVAVPAVGSVAVLLLGRPRFGTADLLDQLDPVLLRVERRFTREHTEPTSKAAPFLEVDLHSAVQALLSTRGAVPDAGRRGLPTLTAAAGLARLRSANHQTCVAPATQS